MAQMANRIFGTNIGPWDIPDLDETTLDLIGALARGAPEIKKNLAKVEAAKARYWQPFNQRKH
jgi:hypothetical protein